MASSARSDRIKREQVSTGEQHSNVQNQRIELSSLSRGTKLGRYQIRSQIGTGGMGEVYLAEDTELGRTVAIKILPEAFASDQQLVQRFIEEAKAAPALNRPHILTIYEVGTTTFPPSLQLSSLTDRHCANTSARE